MAKLFTTGPARYAPGLLLCMIITIAASLLEHAETALLGRAWLEALVLAILLGTVVRTAWTPGPAWRYGINLSAKTLLEVAVVLLGASLSIGTVLAAGWGLLIGIAVVVVVAICASYLIGRTLGLTPRMAVLVACGNSICGNSAIAAVAPVIGADGEDVASSIAFTAVLGVAVVLILPLLMPLAHLNVQQFGVLAGLTVYAVPQVLAATTQVGGVSVQIGTLVKLVRVLMLGPVVLCLSLITQRMRNQPENPAPDVTAGDRPTASSPPVRFAAHKFVPWFIIGFAVLMALRSMHALPESVFPPISFITYWLTVISMAALGFGVDVRTVARAGIRVSAAVTLSLILLGAMSIGLIRLLALA